MLHFWSALSRRFNRNNIPAENNPPTNETSIDIYHTRIPFDDSGKIYLTVSLTEGKIASLRMNVNGVIYTEDYVPLAKGSYHVEVEATDENGRVYRKRETISIE